VFNCACVRASLLNTNSLLPHTPWLAYLSGVCLSPLAAYRAYSIIPGFPQLRAATPESGKVSRDRSFDRIAYVHSMTILAGQGYRAQKKGKRGERDKLQCALHAVCERRSSVALSKHVVELHVKKKKNVGMLEKKMPPRLDASHTEFLAHARNWQPELGRVPCVCWTGLLLLPKT
jgi:hypothetical protein